MKKLSHRHEHVELRALANPFTPQHRCRSGLADAFSYIFFLLQYIFSRIGAFLKAGLHARRETRAL
ncbi:MAG: hypothetical protein NTV17_03630 [Burkholderiales bacterium]|nr:hypothetical protein [Burkholderiales bacterium]